MQNINEHVVHIISGLIYIVDSSDKERLSEAKDELDGILNSDEMRGVPVVVMANKQDLPRKFFLSSYFSIVSDFHVPYQITFVGYLFQQGCK